MTAWPYPGIHVYAVKPFAGGQEWTVSSDDLLHARTMLEVASRCAGKEDRGTRK